MRLFVQISIFSFLMISGLSLANCSGIKSEPKYPTGADRAITEGDIYSEPQGIFGNGGLLSLGGKNKNADNGVGVNSYLWRASLDTISFLPLDNADPFGGVITTDWYSPADTPNERLKVNVLVLSKILKSDGIKVNVFKQQIRGGSWTDIAVSPQTEQDLENAILTRARQLRVGDL